MIKPIICNADTVNGILDGQQRSVRQIMVPQPLFKTYRNFVFADSTCPKEWEDCDDITKTYQYHPGDCLFVKETWCQMKADDTAVASERYIYKADNTENKTGIFSKLRWRSPASMPKEAARIFLKVTDIRIERLQDMNLDDFLAAGVVLRPEAFNDPDNAYYQARDQFAVNWDSEHIADYSWNSNPYVWVIEFERCNIPADELLLCQDSDNEDKRGD